MLLQDDYGTLPNNESLSNQKPSLIISYISKYLIGNTEIPEKETHRYLRYMMNFLALLFGSIAGIPWIDSAQDAAGDYYWLGWIFAVATILSYGASSTWLLLNIAKNLEVKRPEEIEISHENPRLNICKHLTVNGLGILASLPWTYAAYKFNNTKEFAVIVAFTSYGFKTAGYYKLINNKNRAKNLCYSLKKTRNIPAQTQPKDELKNIIKNAYYEVINLPMVTKNTALSALYAQRNSHEQNLQRAELLMKQFDLLHKSKEKQRLPEEWHGGWPKKSVKLIGCIIPVVAAVINVNLAIESAQLIYDNVIFTIFYVLLTDVPSFVLDLTAAINLFDRFFDVLFNFAIKNKRGTFVDLFFPHISTAIPIVSLIVTSLGASNRAFVFYETFNGNSKLPLTIIAVIGAEIFQLFAMQDLIKEFILYYTNLRYSGEIKKTAHICIELTRLESVLDNIKTVDIIPIDNNPCDSPNIKPADSIDLDSINNTVAIDENALTSTQTLSDKKNINNEERSTATSDDSKEIFANFTNGNYNPLLLSNRHETRLLIEHAQMSDETPDEISETKRVYEKQTLYLPS